MMANVIDENLLVTEALIYMNIRFILSYHFHKGVLKI